MNRSDQGIDGELLEAAQTGDERAWRELVDRLYPLVAGIIRNHLRRVDDREDVAQEVFVRLFTRLGSYAGRQPFEHWVSRITLNCCHDWLRRIKARPLRSYSDLGETELEILERTLRADTPHPADDPRQLRELLDRLIAGLKPREQIVIRLLDLEERSVQDACELTGWGASKVKVTAMRARRKLAEQLQRLQQRERTD